tara:strand:+ start:17 stop:166 length:150 start_codon:yes stop_codon:yes gene_type:complete
MEPISEAQIYEKHDVISQISEIANLKALIYEASVENMLSGREAIGGMQP